MYFLFMGILAVSLVFLVTGYARAAQDVEVPAYTVELKAGKFEVRQYPALVMAQITTEGSRRSAVRRSFSPLARYIFAKNRPGEKIAMTAPVMQEPTTDGWMVSFIMPAGRTIADLPVPDGAVALVKEPSRRVAVVRFSGWWTDRKFRDATNQLENWIARQDLVPVGAPEFGYYNDPFTLPVMRRNEVLIEIAR